MAPSRFSAQTIFSLTALVALSIASPAQAGFEWKGQAPQPSAPAETATAVPPPVMAWDGTVDPTMPPMNMPAVQASAVESNPVPPPELPPVFETPVATATPEATGDIVSGFGSDLPLAIALQQIVPPGHQFSFGVGVNPGTPVSWEGGKAWTAVLSDTLAGAGLSYTTANNVIHLNRGTTPATAPVALTQADLPDVSGIVDAPQAPQAATPVNIRRSKPSTLVSGMKRMWQQDEQKTAAPVENTVVMRQSSATAEAPAVAEMPAVDMTAPISITPAEMSTMPPVQASPAPEMSVIAPSTQANADAIAATWQGGKGQTLRDVLKNWSDVAGVELYWSIDYDYRLPEDVGFAGTYDEAVGAALDRFAAIRPQPYGQLHQSSDGPRVLVIKSYDLIQ